MKLVAYVLAAFAWLATGVLADSAAAPRGGAPSKPKALVFQSAGSALPGQALNCASGKCTDQVKTADFTLDTKRLKVGQVGKNKGLYLYLAPGSGASLDRVKGGYLLPRKTVTVDLPKGAKVQGVRLVPKKVLKITGPKGVLRLARGPTRKEALKMAARRGDERTARAKAKDGTRGTSLGARRMPDDPVLRSNIPKLSTRNLTFVGRPHDPISGAVGQKAEEDFYPGQALKYHTGNTRTCAQVYVWVWPVQHQPSTGRTVVITDGTIEVYYAE